MTGLFQVAERACLLASLGTSANARSLVYFPRRSMRRRCVTPPVRQRTSRSSRSAVPDILSPRHMPHENHHHRSD